MRRSDDLIGGDVADEVVLLSVALSKYYGLNPVGSRIWTLLDTPMSAADLCGRLAGEYDVPVDVCERETLDFLNTLAVEGLVVEVASAERGAPIHGGTNGLSA